MLEGSYPRQNHVIGGLLPTNQCPKYKMVFGLLYGRWDQHGANHGYTFKTYEEDPAKVIASINNAGAGSNAQPKCQGERQSATERDRAQIPDESALDALFDAP